MFKNYLKMAVRRLFRHKIFFSINVFGLAIGMTCSLLIMLYVANELSFDRFHVGVDRIFRICMTGRIGGKDLHVARSVRPMASTLVNEFPEVEQATRKRTPGNDAQPVILAGGQDFQFAHAVGQAVQTLLADQSHEVPCFGGFLRLGNMPTRKIG